MTCTADALKEGPEAIYSVPSSLKTPLQLTLHGPPPVSDFPTCNTLLGGAVFPVPESLCDTQEVPITVEQREDASLHCPSG